MFIIDSQCIKPSLFYSMQQKCFYLSSHDSCWANAGVVLRWGRENCPRPTNLGLTPKCDMKHCLTNSKHRHMQKGAFFILQSTPKCFFLSDMSQKSGCPHEYTPLLLYNPSPITKLNNIVSEFWCRLLQPYDTLLCACYIILCCLTLVGFKYFSYSTSLPGDGSWQ